MEECPISRLCELYYVSEPAANQYLSTLNVLKGVFGEGPPHLHSHLLVHYEALARKTLQIAADLLTAMANVGAQQMGLPNQVAREQSVHAYCANVPTVHWMYTGEATKGIDSWWVAYSFLVQSIQLDPLEPCTVEYVTTEANAIYRKAIIANTPLFSRHGRDYAIRSDNEVQGLDHLTLVSAFMQKQHGNAIAPTTSPSLTLDDLSHTLLSQLIPTEYVRSNFVPTREEVYYLYLDCSETGKSLLERTVEAERQDPLIRKRIARAELALHSFRTGRSFAPDKRNQLVTDYLAEKQRQIRDHERLGSSDDDPDLKDARYCLEVVCSEKIS